MRKLIDADELAGKTVRCCLPNSTYGGIVIVFDDNDWCHFLAIDGNDDTAVLIDGDVDGCRSEATEYLIPFDLLQADLITEEQYALLVAEKNKKEAERKRALASRLMAEAEQLQKTS